MSTHVEKIPIPSLSGEPWDRDPPSSPNPGSRTDGAWSRRPSPAPNFPLTLGPPVTEGAGDSVGGAREAAEASGSPESPLSAGRPPHSQAWAWPIFDPAPPRPAALGERLPPRCPGAAARRRPGWQPPQAEGVPGTVVLPGPAPSAGPGSAPHLPPLPLHAPLGRGPDPTRLLTAPLSPWAGPGRSRGLS